MKIPGFYITLLWIFISWIASVILAYDSSIYMYWFVTLWILVTIIWAYTQYTESQTVKIKLDLKEDIESGKFICHIPYSKYKKKNPVLSMIWPNYESCWFEWPKQILDDGTIIIESDTDLKEDRYFLIK